MTTAPKRMGRPPVKPSVDDAEAVQRLCEHLVAGESMATACARPECPAERMVYLRMSADEDFRSVIAAAREAQQHAIIDGTVDMADAATPEDWQVVKLRIWARQWRAAKLLPKVYGDKVTNELVGKDGSALPAPALYVEFVRPQRAEPNAPE